MASAWEVRGEPPYSVERGTSRDGDLEVAATGIQDYQVACLIEFLLNFREGIEID